MSSYATISLLGDVGPQGRSEFILTNKLVIPFDPFVVANAQGGSRSAEINRSPNYATSARIMAFALVNAVISGHAEERPKYLQALNLGLHFVGTVIKRRAGPYMHIRLTSKHT